MKDGSATTEREAERAIIDAIDKRETERAIARGEAEIAAGLGIPLDDNFVKNLQERVFRKLREE